MILYRCKIKTKNYQLHVVFIIKCLACNKDFTETRVF